MAVITLLTDFGLTDYFVPSMKGVILSINPSATIIDITHDVPKFNVLRAAFILKSAYKWFPKGTIHVVVVDPGVGTPRKPIAIRGRSHVFVGPDNGVLSLAAEEDGVVEAREIKSSGNASFTFHGRDIFAPIAARLSAGIEFSDVGPVTEFQRLELMKPHWADGFLAAMIIYVDSFGNAFTNVTADQLQVDYGTALDVELQSGSRVRVRLERSYGYVPPGEPLALINSEGYLELAVNQGSFADRFKVVSGASIRIIPVR
ncbi:hypothetical protein GCM10007981_02350 [Thermocladium modestius]|uniref:SAM-dependent chlorinase/fluorinase n=1 Tax=Thermocladium modestius TaxID=62609 RepID=A0A830GU91_9CREN|nr:SAM-dependent chlorinase/fluorinase [Thermocladium modestius]GGP19284.1 hypothetical protein GCM10007981_02350 [Thermocladium modestius]